MRQAWVEILRANLQEVEGQPGCFRPRTSAVEPPFVIEHAVRVILGAGEFSPFSAGAHEHQVFYKGSPSGSDIAFDTNSESFLVVRTTSRDKTGPGEAALEIRSHTHHIPWGKIVDVEIIEAKRSQ
jgi:hypothetical protein